MCWCTPSIRTPVCGKPGCHPPVAGAHADKPDWQVRVIEEKAQLDEKIDKLTLFFGTLAYAKLDDTDRHLLQAQRSWMQNYSNVLAQRIERFSRVQAIES